MQRNLTGIAGWQKNSFIDFPGTVATVLFFSGCNLACPYCHNPRVVDAKPADEISGEEILAFLEKRKKTIDGVVLSGGEPTLHGNIVAAAADIRGLGYRIKLDTNGLLPEMITRISPDFLSMDLKTLPRLYAQHCKSPYANTEERLRAALEIVKAMKHSAELRITCAPGFVTRDIVEEFAVLIKGVAQVFLQPMQNKVPLLDPEFAKKELIDPKEIVAFRDILSSNVERCDIRGRN
jgi:pyruvate formate lyase activating enzyme